MIEVRELTKDYPGVRALENVSFDVPKGEVAGFLGPNGAGKTTTMRILAGFLAPSSGRATVAGFDVVTKSMEVRRRLGYLPESNALYTEMRVEEYLSFRATIKEVPRKERRGRIEEAMKSCGLEDMRKRIIGHLSKGYRQRVGLADAIVNRPEVIILDEPTIGLDPNQKQDVLKMMRQMGKERTVILSTHILDEAEEICNRFVVIHRGKVAAAGTRDEIAHSQKIAPRVRFEVTARDGREAKADIESVAGVKSVGWSERGAGHLFTIELKDGKDVRPELMKLVAAKKWEVKELSMQTATLKELFTDLTRGGGAA